MKTRYKGKVHPFTSSSSSHPQHQNRDTLLQLNLLPATILTLVSVLSPSDTEVLAYMVRRSLEYSIPSEDEEGKRKSSKKKSIEGHGHKSPVLFDCDCFQCYTSFWVRWDSSPNRELIHKAIEAFEDHLGSGEKLKKNVGSGRNRRREKKVRRKSVTAAVEDGGLSVTDIPPGVVLENQEMLAGVETEMAEADGEWKEEKEAVALPPGMSTTAADAAIVLSHKGLARKVLPDFIGIFNSRLWNLWNPNM